MKDKIARIERLEKLFVDKHVVVLAIDESGKRFKEPVRDMIQKKHSFQKVWSGNNIHDIELCLDWIRYHNHVGGGAEWYITDEFKKKVTTLPADRTGACNR